MEVFILEHYIELCVLLFIVVGSIIAVIETATSSFDDRYPEFLYSEREREIKRKEKNYYDFAKSLKKGKGKRK